MPRELQAEVERDVASQSQDVAERREVGELVRRRAVNTRSRYHEQGEALGERIRPRAREAAGDRGEKDDVRIVPSPRVEVGEVEGRALEDVLEREKRAFRAEKLRGLLRSRGGGAFEVRSRW